MAPFDPAPRGVGPGRAIFVSSNEPTVGHCTFTAHVKRVVAGDAKVTIGRDAVFVVDRPKPKRVRRRP